MATEETASSSTNTTTEQRASKREKGTAGIELITQAFNMLRPYELSRTNRLSTFQEMMQDDSVFDCFNTNATFVEGAFANYSIEYNKNSEASKLAADFLKWNLNNLDNQTVRSIARSAIEFKRDGLSPFEKVFERGFGKHSTTPQGNAAWKIKSLNYISPYTLHQPEPFVIDGGGRNIKEMRQKATAFKNSRSETQSLPSKTGYVSIPYSKLILMTVAATDAQPFGRSPFEAAYTAWRTKQLLQDLMTVGVSKDLAGMPLLRIPSQILNEAAADPSSPSGQMVELLKEGIANLHAGDQASMILPSDTFSESGNGAKEYEVSFVGIEGSGKSFNLEVLIEQQRKFIYSCFGAVNLISNDSSGGYNQLEGQTNLHSHHINRDIAVIEEGFNTNLIPQLFRLNEWDLEEGDMPVIKAGDLAPPSLDEIGKFVQRLAATSFLPRNVQVVNELLEKSGLSYRVPEDTSKEELDGMLFGEMSSRSGDGMKTPFEGTSKGNGNSGNSSDTNSDNAS